MRRSHLAPTFLFAVLFAAAALAQDPIVYTIRAPSPETHVAAIEAVYPTDMKETIELMMAVWSPGFYRVENYATKVQELTAHTPDGSALTVEKPKDNRWRIATKGASRVVVDYRLLCQGRSVTTNQVEPGYAVFQGPATFLTLADQTARPHEVRLELPPAWLQSMTALDAAPDGKPDHYVAPDFDVLADSPIVAGTLAIHEFDVHGSRHLLVDFGEVGSWDGAQAAAKLQPIAAEHDRFLGGLPFSRYVFLNVFRPGAGGLEHRNSALLSSSPGTAAPTLHWLQFVSHEYFHAINVKRLRPIELGPFDYENPPRTASLWIAEGLTTWYGDLAVTRSGAGTAGDFLGGMSTRIRQLQRSPGRLVQSLERASLDVWTSGTSGIGGDAASTVSYYVKGPVVGLLLDVRIRHVTQDQKCLDDVMRLAYQHFSGARGFTPKEFEATASEVAGTDLHEFFQQYVSGTAELDYAETLDWFGLRFQTPAQPESAPPTWVLEALPDATEAQQRHLQHLLAPTPEREQR